MAPKTSSPASVFEKVLRAYETGGFTYTDVLEELNLLLATGASPTELLEILRRRELIEPLPEYAHVKVLGLLNEAVGRAAAHAVVPDVAQNADSDTAPDHMPDSVPAPPRSTSTAPPIQQVEAPAEEPTVALASVFKRFLNAVETRGYTDTDVVAQLQRLLLATSASPTALLEILRRRGLMEPLPEYAYAQVLGLLEDAMGKAAAHAVVSGEAQKSVPETAAVQIPDLVPAPPRPKSIAPPSERTKDAAKAPTVVLTSLRNPDLTSMAIPNRTTFTDSVPAAAPRQTRPAAARNPTTSPAPGPAPIPISGPIPVIGLTRSTAEGAPAVVIPPLEPPPVSLPAKSGTTPTVPIQATAPEPTRTAVSPAASTGVPTPAPATTSPSHPSAVEAAVPEEEITINLDELDDLGEDSIPPRAAAARDSAAVGDVLMDRYRLAALIGEGGMSRVYKATDSTMRASPDSFVAVKVLTRPINEDFGSFSSFRDEVQKLRGLAHPNIVRIFDCDRDGSTVFITMEYLAGPSLYTKLHSGAATGKPRSGLNGDEARTIVLAIADALDYAHRNNVVHGDLKPGNVIVIDRGEIKVIDFEIASWVARPKTVLEGPEPAQEKTSPAVTPQYASPQLMARQKPEPADDVYALACLAYEIFTGTHPFGAAAGAQSLKFPPPRRAELSSAQYSALVHGLQRDRSDRTPTVRQFAAEFSASERGGGWKPGAIARAIGMSTAVLIIAVAAWFFAHHAPPAPTQVPAVSSAAVPNPGTVIRDCPICPAMTVLPAGRFKQGSDRAESGSASFEKPAHWVVIGRALAMSTHAVTVDEFQEFIAATGRDMQGCDTYDGEWKHRPTNSWKNPGFVQTGTHPVACTSWKDAEAYAGWLSATTGHKYRLPSASEWEYAARAGGEAVQPWNPDGSGACANANVADQSAAHRYPGWTVFACDDGYVYTAPVGSFKTNAFGLNDMLGNVFQWTEDCWHADYTGAPIDGSARTDGNCSEHELRGGSWFSTPAYVRADYRNHFAADYRTSSVGIRLVRDIDR